MANVQEKLNAKGRAAIAGWKNTCKKLWEKACQVEGVPVDSKFVVFSDSNKFAQFHSQAYMELVRAIAEYQAGGYVGLRIVNGRAQ